LWDGQSFVVGWRELRPNSDTVVSLRRIGPGLNLSSRLDAATAVFPAVTAGAALAFDGIRVWIAWEEFDGGAATQASVMVRRVQAGTFTGPAQAVQATDKMWERQPALVYEPSLGDMAVAHADSLSHQITFQRVTVDGAAPLLSPVPIVSTGDAEQVHPLLIRGATTTLVAWETSSAIIYGTRLRDTATPLDAPPLLLSRSLNPEYSPMVAGGDTGFAVVWRDQRLGGARLFGTTLSPDGAPLLPVASPLITDPPGVGSDAVGWGGGQFLAVGVGTPPGMTGIPLLGRLFGLDGSPTSPVFTAATQQQAANHIAYAGGTFLVVGQGTAPSTGKVEVHATRVRADGTAPGMTVVDGSGNAYTAMGVASDGARFLAVWTAGGAAIAGRFVGTDGALVGTSPITVATGTGLFGPAATFGAGVYLVVWQESGPRRIMGALVSAAGAVQSPGAFPISAPAGDESDAYPGVAFDGTRFVVGWKALQLPEGGLAVAHEIRYAPVTPAGVVGATELGAIDDGSDTLTDPIALASGTDGRVALAYTQADSPGGYPIARTRIRILRSTPAAGGGGCITGPECASGFCVDGVCCATACAGGPVDCQACSRLAGAALDGVCAPVPDGRACGAHGMCAAGICQERDGGTTSDGGGAPDGSNDGGTDTAGEAGKDAVADAADGGDAAIDGLVEAAADRAADALADGSPDAGSDDASTDAGDGGPAADASPPIEPALDAGRDAAADIKADRSGTTSKSGCSCNVGTDASASWLTWPLLLLASARWRRRRRR